ncbi:hypothetical protein L249_0286 [Ophiocordyceps polyrhachis-furcata BCC 54312]|uniref:ATP-dependent RNA helicase n=1 Tax=Ophiocordyceps polyrhachis-furcata BCC 54312 TaxID=1330021 RepID=A0A367LFM7_9HYPO|nr:hypothetical protein L249_0286 [Ophiocordyceps polyrhachis-furcata BCC 54312]
MKITLGKNRSYRLIPRAWPRSDKFLLAWLMPVELAILVPVLVIFGIAQPDLYRTAMWRIGFENKLNSNPNMILYAFANHRPLPDVPFIWSSTWVSVDARLTSFNVAISIVSLFFLLIKLIGYIMRTWYPVFAIFANIALVVLYAVSVYGQVGPDYADARYQASAAWYFRQGCGLAKQYDKYQACQIAQASLAITLLLLRFSTVYLINLAIALHATWPNRENDVSNEDDEDVATLDSTERGTWEMHSMKAPASTPYTPRTQAFYTLDRQLPLRQPDYGQAWVHDMIWTYWSGALSKALGIYEYIVSGNDERRKGGHTHKSKCRRTAPASLVIMSASSEEKDEYLSDNQSSDSSGHEWPARPLSQTFFAPPFYGRPPTPLPPSPSLTSLLRPSRPTTPDASDDENMAPVPRASPQVPTYEYYGFVLYLFSSMSFLLWLLWSYLPAPFLHGLGIYYYPNRWWALAIPAFLTMTLCYIYVALASYNTEMMTLPMASVETVVDGAGKLAVIDAKGRLRGSNKRERKCDHNGRLRCRHGYSSSRRMRGPFRRRARGGGLNEWLFDFHHHRLNVAGYINPTASTLPIPPAILSAHFQDQVKTSNQTAMDILKLLSRGTKRPSQAKRAGSDASIKLPSAGTKTNPQLFHDHAHGQKRKRDEDEPLRKHAVEDLPVVDFFAPKVEASHFTTYKAQQAPSPAAQPSERLSVDACRELLRSHRLKLTVMTEPDGRQASKRKEKASKGKEIENKNKSSGVGAKPDKRQLFPQPLRSFGELRSTYGISRRVSENLAVQGYRVPTEVQLGALPVLLRPDIAMIDERDLSEGVNFLAVAPTGSGKTVSFLIPAINSIMRRRALQGLQGIHELEAVIVAPTRELVFQIVNEGRKLTQGTGLRVTGMRKGTRVVSDQSGVTKLGSGAEEDDDDDDESQSEDDKPAVEAPAPVAKADILVTTPLLLFRSLTSETADGQCKTLPTVRELVLDEADVLLDALFREQTLGIWTACRNPSMRVSCWSATMGSNIESLVVDKLKEWSETRDIRLKPLVRLVVGLRDTAVPNIAHRLIYTASETGKLMALRQLLHPAPGDDAGPPLRPPFLVFTQTIDRASALREELKYDIPLEAGGPSRIEALHSELSDSARAAIMRKFRAGDIWVLITTDVLARGVDFAGVNGVVNYDVPGSSAAYVHRAGRTGRAGREGGVAVTLYTKDDIPFVKTVANAIAISEKQAGKTGSQAGVQKWLLDALPNVARADRKKLKYRGVDSRRSGTGAKITSKSGYDRRREHNRMGAIAGSKRRISEARRDVDEAQVDEEGEEEEEEEWTGFGD